MSLAIEDSFTKDALLAVLKKNGSHRNWTFNMEKVSVEVAALLEIMIEQIPSGTLAAAKSELGVTTTAQAKKKLRESGIALFGKLKEKAVEGVTNHSLDAVNRAAKLVAPKIATTVVRLLFT